LPRKPNEKISQAFELYKAGNRLIDIAKELDVPEGTVRQWKCTHKWDGERSLKQNERQEKKAIAEEVESVINNPELNDKQRLFCLYYIRLFNATKAYQKAFGCKRTVASAEGYKLLAKPCVKAEILKLKRERLNREFLSEADIFQKYIDIAFADITDFVEIKQNEEYVINQRGVVTIKDSETGEKKLLKQKVNAIFFKDVTSLDGAIITEIKSNKNGISFKLADRMRALDWLASHMDLATDEQKAKIAQLKAQTEKLSGNTQETEQITIIDDLEDN